MVGSSLRVPPPPPSLGPRRRRSRMKHQRDAYAMPSPLTPLTAGPFPSSGQADSPKLIEEGGHPEKKHPDLCPLGNTDGTGSSTQCSFSQRKAVEAQEDKCFLRKGLLAKPEIPSPTPDNKVDMGSTAKFPDSPRHAIVPRIQTDYISKTIATQNRIKLHEYAGQKPTSPRMEIFKMDSEQETPATPFLEQIIEDDLDKPVKATISGVPVAHTLDKPTEVPMFDDATLRDIEKEIAAAKKTSILLPPVSVPTDVIFKYANPRNPGKRSAATSEAKKKPIGPNERPARREGGGEELVWPNSGVPLPMKPWPEPLEHPSADLGALTPSSNETSSPKQVLKYESSSRVSDMGEELRKMEADSGASTPGATGSHTVDKILSAASSLKSLAALRNTKPQPLIMEVQNSPTVEIDKRSNIDVRTCLKNGEVGSAFDLPVTAWSDEVLKPLVTDINLKAPNFLITPPKLLKPECENVDRPKNTRKEFLNTINVKPYSGLENIYPSSMNSNIHPDTPRSRCLSLQQTSGLKCQLAFVDGPAEDEERTFNNQHIHFCYPEAFVEIMTGLSPEVSTSTTDSNDSTSTASMVSQLRVSHTEYHSARRKTSLSGIGTRMGNRLIEGSKDCSNKTFYSVYMGFKSPHGFQASSDGNPDALDAVSPREGRSVKANCVSLGALKTGSAQDSKIKDRSNCGKMSENPKKPQINWNKLRRDVEAEGPQTLHTLPIKDSQGDQGKIIRDMPPTSLKKPQIDRNKLHQDVKEEGPQTVHMPPVSDRQGSVVRDLLSNGTKKSQIDRNILLQNVEPEEPQLVNTHPIKDICGNIIQEIPSTGYNKRQIDFNRLCQEVEAEGSGNVHKLPIKDKKGNIIWDVPQNGPKKLRKKWSSFGAPSSFYRNSIQPRSLDHSGTNSTTTFSFSLPTTTTIPDLSATPIASLLFVIATHLITPIATPAINFTIISRFLTTASFDFLAHRNPLSRTHHAPLSPRELYQVETRISVQRWLDNQQRQQAFTLGDTPRNHARDFALEGQYQPGQTSGALDGIDERTDEDDECAVEEEDDGEDEQRKRWRELERLRRQLGRAGVGVRPTMGIGMSPAMSFVT